MPRRFDHVDLRVRNLEESRSFYEALLPALGFTERVTIEGWLQFETPQRDGTPEFFGVTESPNHVANECRIALWAESRAGVDRLAVVVRQAGGRNIEGPLYLAPRYYAVFFEDPSHNRLEICYRERE